MFTGLVEATGTLRRIERRGPGMRFAIECPLRPLDLGESIAVNGACLTVDHVSDDGFVADLSRETLDKTTLGKLSIGDNVHLERSLAVGQRIGGHLVSGHVDGVARWKEAESVGESRRITLWAPAKLGRYIAEKGSVCLDGVSLTVNNVAPGVQAGGVCFDIMLIPHTLSKTTFGHKKVGSEVNLEVDILARYVSRLVEFGHGDGADEGQPDDDPETGSTARDRTLIAKLGRGGYL